MFHIKPHHGAHHTSYAKFQPKITYIFSVIFLSTVIFIIISIIIYYTCMPGGLKIFSVCYDRQAVYDMYEILIVVCMTYIPKIHE